MQRFLFTNCTLVHNELFVVGAWAGLPARMNPYNGKIEYYDDMKGLIIKQNSVVIDFLESYQDKVYALDSKGKNLVVFNLKKNKCQYISLNFDYQREIDFAAFERYQSNFYIFSKYSNMIQVFNAEKNEIMETVRCLDNSGGIQCACRVRNSVWILPKNEDMLYCYDLLKRSKQKYELHRVLHDCVHAVFQDGCIYILNRFGKIYIWNINERKLSEITVSETEHDEELSMSRIIAAGNKLILLPGKNSTIKILDLIAEKVEIYHDYPENFYDQTVWLRFYGYCEDEKYYYFAMCASNYLLKIEKRSGELIWIKPEYSKRKEIRFHYERNKGILGESSFCELHDLIRYLPQNKKYQGSMADIGGKIYMEL